MDVSRPGETPESGVGSPSSSVIKPDLERFVANMGSLPSLPSLYLQLTEELRSPDVTATRISQIVSKDLAMTSKILQIVNSAYFGLSRQIASVERAILLMGLEMLRSFVLSVEVFSMFEPQKMAGLTVAGLWRHSMNCAAIARRISSTEGLPRAQADHVSTAGFLHDIGKLLMANEKPLQYGEVSRLMLSEQLSSFDAEQQVFGFDHAEAGGLLLSRWRLPETVVQTVRWHHDPSGAAPEEIGTVTIVHVTDWLEHEQNDEMPDATIIPDEDFLSSISAGAHLERWRNLVRDTV